MSRYPPSCIVICRYDYLLHLPPILMQLSMSPPLPSQALCGARLCLRGLWLWSLQSCGACMHSSTGHVVHVRTCKLAAGGFRAGCSTGNSTRKCLVKGFLVHESVCIGKHRG